MIGTSTLLWRWWRCGRNSAQQAWREQRLRLFSGILVLVIVWLLVFGLSWGLINFLEREQPAFKDALLYHLVSLLFMILSVLVTISATIITWASLFRTPSGRFLAQLPVSNRALYWHAAIEGGTWASWALLVLGMPILLALCREAQQPWLFAIAAVLTLLCFQLCCIGLGAAGSILLARLIPLLRRGVRGFIIVAVLALIVGAVLLLSEVQRSDEKPIGFVRQMVAQIGFIDNPYYPSRWVAVALQNALHAEWLAWLGHCVLLLSAAGAIAIGGEWLAARRLRLDLDLLTGRPESRRNRSRPWQPLPWLPKDLAIMVAKDWRVFRRDPSQVLQLGLFVLMLTFYIFMLPRIGLAFQSISWWSRAVSVLNVCAISMALATFTGRFVYPMMSLEGRRMWVLALAPWSSNRLIYAKFLFAVLVGTPVAVVLVCLSGRFLHLSTGVIIYQGLITCGIAASLAASAIGLGTRYANYHEDNPTKLVSSYGGTLNLLVSLVIVCGCLIGAGLPLIGYGSGDSWIIGVLWSALWCGSWTVGMLRFAQRCYRHNLNGG